MQSPKGKMKPIKVLRDVRQSVSEILDKPFTEHIDHQLFKPDQKILAVLAADCAGHVLPYFESKHPNDDRPRKAIEACRRWAATGVFRMADIRKASLEAHASAREAKEDNVIAAARAAGQAVVMARMSTHAFGASVYAIRAAAAHSGNADDDTKERDWQLARLHQIANV